MPGSEFSAQMQALKAAGWTAVTLDQVEQYWTKGTALPTGKPIVVTFDGGYASQFVNALPVLKGLGWKGVINLPSNGRSPADGGLTDDQTRGLVAAGWELDAAGNDSPDLTGLSTTEIVSDVKAERQDLQARFKAPVNWYSYASGAVQRDRDRVAQRGRGSSGRRRPPRAGQTPRRTASVCRGSRWRVGRVRRRSSRRSPTRRRRRRRRTSPPASDPPHRPSIPRIGL